MDFQKRALYRLQFPHRKLSIFTKSPDFNEIKDIKEIRDFLPDFKREPSTEKMNKMNIFQ